MHCQIEAPTGGVIAKPRCNVVGQGDLSIRVELTAYLGRRGCAKRAFPQCNETWPHVIEHLVQLICGDAQFVIFNKRVIRGLVVARDGLGIVPRQVNHLFQHWQKQRHIVRCPRIGPDAL